MSFITYEPWGKVSCQSHEHATIHYRNDGIILILSREEIRSVARKWDVIGTWNGNNFRFTENSQATRLAATALRREGKRVKGAPPVKWEWSGKIIALASDGITTNPESIRGRIRDREPGNARDKRRKVQGLFGKIGTVDVSAMRAAILAREKD